MKCASCETKVGRDDAFYGDKGTFYDSKPLCENCFYEDAACASVLYNDDEEPKIISHTRNETDGDFSVHWKSTDPWRGYFETKSETYSLVNTAELLAGHESEKMLKSFDDRIKELFAEHDVDYSRVFARSSNVFYQNYDLYVKNEHALVGNLLVAKAKSEVDYENPKWYRNIIFDENGLNKLSELFPEHEVKTDQDALKLFEKNGEEMLNELKKRIEAKAK